MEHKRNEGYVIVSRFTGATDPVMENINASISYDFRDPSCGEVDLLELQILTWRTLMPKYLMISGNQVVGR